MKTLFFTLLTLSSVYAQKQTSHLETAPVHRELNLPIVSFAPEETAVCKYLGYEAYVKDSATYGNTVFSVYINNEGKLEKAGKTARVESLICINKIEIPANKEKALHINLPVHSESKIPIVGLKQNDETGVCAYLSAGRYLKNSAKFGKNKNVISLNLDGTIDGMMWTSELESLICIQDL
ncbi:MAG: hypothetical protein JNM93_04840 [Bacteriovoracaceae bacterium]|nr:hypothetical protein [Bacteriovoracaceae bacterium]